MAVKENYSCQDPILDGKHNYKTVHLLSCWLEIKIVMKKDISSDKKKQKKK
jgi:hypothetical protein